MRKILASLLLVFALFVFAPAITSCQSGGGSTGTQHSGNPNVKVWVNTPTHVYHCPGTRWHGQTKTGVYMTQKEAQEKGNRPAHGKHCE